MNILYLYDANQTHTNTVFDHLVALGIYSQNRAFFMHADSHSGMVADMSRFDAVCIHYSIRLPFDGVSPAIAQGLQSFQGLKFLFIQDEYDNTHRAWHWIKHIGFHLVFTVVPEAGIPHVYPREEFPHTRFVSNLTGYAPPAYPDDVAFVPPSQRPLVVGYRGRPLPVRYGALGFEKIAVGKMVREYCNRQGISNDIDWTEESRIYGPAWSSFVGSCRAMLGSESGSNVFDWDGCLQARLDTFLEQHSKASNTEVYEQIVKPLELNGIMNQVSPRIFEAIAAHTVLVLFEGEYSEVVQPNEHFIVLKKDGSNLDEVFKKLEDKDYVDSMAQRAYEHVIASGKFSYPVFVAMVDREVEQSYRNLPGNKEPFTMTGFQRTPTEASPMPITVSPIRAVMNNTKPRFLPTIEWNAGMLKLCFPVIFWWLHIPEPIRARLLPLMRRAKHTLVSGGQ